MKWIKVIAPPDVTCASGIDVGTVIGARQESNGIWHHDGWQFRPEWVEVLKPSVVRVLEPPSKTGCRGLEQGTLIEAVFDGGGWLHDRWHLLPEWVEEHQDGWSDELVQAYLETLGSLKIHLDGLAQVYGWEVKLEGGHKIFLRKLVGKWFYQLNAETTLRGPFDEPTDALRDGMLRCS